MRILKKCVVISPIKNRLSNSVFAFYLFFLLALLPLIATPLVGDDFAGYLSTGSKLDLNLSLVHNWTIVWDSMPMSTHINIIGQFTAVIWTKFWILISIHLSIPAYLGFYLIKTILFSIFAIQIARFLQRVLTISRLNSLKIVFLLIPLFLTAHFPWSNDPVTGLPLAGLFSFIVGIQAIISLLTLFQLRNFRSSFLSTLWLVIAIFTYELNFSLIFVYLYLLVTSRVVVLNRLNFQHLLIFKDKTLAIVLFPFFTILLVVYLANLNWGTQRNTYGGTTLDINMPTRYLEALAVNSFSTLSPAVWIRGLQLTNLQPWLLFFTLIICIYLYFRLKNSFDFMSFAINSHGGREAFYGLSLWALLGTAIQTLGYKIQEDASFLGYVYLFHLPQVAVLFIAFIILLVWMAKKDGHRRLMIYLSIVIFFMNTISNVSVNLWGHTFFKQNSLLLDALTTESKNNERCVLLAEWEQKANPDQYKVLTREGINQISLKYRSVPYCELK
jgi:hypothetical protein